jgi:hypothetical protein
MLCQCVAKESERFDNTCGLNYNDVVVVFWY